MRSGRNDSEESVTAAVITSTRIDLVSIQGPIDHASVDTLSSRMLSICSTCSGSLVVNLSRVESCDAGLFHVLSQADQILTGRGGRLQLVGVGPAVLNALDKAPLHDVLLVHRASDWTS